MVSESFDGVCHQEVRLVVDGDEHALDDSAVGDVEHVRVGDEFERLCGGHVADGQKAVAPVPPQLPAFLSTSPSCSQPDWHSVLKTCPALRKMNFSSLSDREGRSSENCTGC